VADQYLVQSVLVLLAMQLFLFFSSKLFLLSRTIRVNSLKILPDMFWLYPTIMGHQKESVANGINQVSK
jgi:hypothetical protein